MHPTKFRFMWPSGFRKEYLKIDQSDLLILESNPIFYFCYTGIELLVFVSKIQMYTVCGKLQYVPCHVCNKLM
jgi:hypothetical protein